MRILFTALPAYGHLLPLLPLARAARDVGDDVLISTHASLCETVGDLPFAAAGAALSDLMVESSHRNGGIRPGDLNNLSPIVDMFTGIRVELSYAGALAVARRHQPDVIVADHGDFVAPLVAAALGVPWITHGITTARPPSLSEGFADGLANCFKDLGLAPIEPHVFVDVWPTWLQPQGYRPPVGLISVQPQAYQNEHAPAFEATFPGREELPTILLTFGTVVDDRLLLHLVVQQILRLDVNVIIAFGPEREGQYLGVDPDRVRMVGFAPMNQLLRNVSAVVSSGGAGTVLAALSRGLPMLLIPMFAEHPLVADQVCAYGAALQQQPGERMDLALTAVLSESRFRERAQKAAEQLATAYTPAETWDIIRTQVRGH